MKRFALTILLILFAFNGFGQSIPRWKITDVENYIASGNGDVLVINCWATFCKPCVAEIPSFISITNRYKDQHVKLLLVSLDLPSAFPKKIAAFAKQHKFNTSIIWLDETNADYFCPKIDKQWSGSIPATLIINTKTGYRKFFEEELKPEAFEQALKEVMKM